MHYQRLRDIREDCDKTQAEIAAVLGITTQQYQLYESGKREIKAHQLASLAKFYNVSADYLLGLIDTPRKI
jgi:transcriptional regulator with XRE-family HTH domain